MRVSVYIYIVRVSVFKFELSFEETIKCSISVRVQREKVARFIDGTTPTRVVPTEKNERSS